MVSEKMTDAHRRCFPRPCAAGNDCFMKTPIVIGNAAVCGKRCRICKRIWHDVCVEDANAAAQGGSSSDENDSAEFLCAGCDKSAQKGEPLTTPGKGATSTLGEQEREPVTEPHDQGGDAPLQPNEMSPPPDVHDDDRHSTDTLVGTHAEIAPEIAPPDVLLDPDAGGDTPITRLRAYPSTIYVFWIVVRRFPSLRMYPSTIYMFCIGLRWFPSLRVYPSTIYMFWSVARRFPILRVYASTIYMF